MYTESDEILLTSERSRRARVCICVNIICHLNEKLDYNLLVDIVLCSPQNCQKREEKNLRNHFFQLFFMMVIKERYTKVAQFTIKLFCSSVSDVGSIWQHR